MIHVRRGVLRTTKGTTQMGKLNCYYLLVNLTEIV